MTALEQVNGYLRQLEARLRALAASRGIALTAGLALLLTLVIVFAGNRAQFAREVILPMRVLLYAAVATAVALLIARPLRKLTRARVRRIAERGTPGLEERLLTVTEHPDPTNPFTELVAEDVLRMTREQPAKALRSTRLLWSLAGAGALAVGLLVWLIVAGPGYWGYGASLLWTGSARASDRPMYAVAVEPGNKTIRRKSDQVIEARLLGFSASKVTLHARYSPDSKWENTAMQPAEGGDKYRFLFPAVSDAVEYYVQADGAQSKHFKLSVKDLPIVKRVRVLLRFPANLGLQNVTDETGGDVRAVVGTRAEISILTDKPLEHGVLAVDKRQRIELTRGDGNWLKAELPVEKDGSYHVAAIDGAETVRISDEYFIEAKKDEAPTVRIARPGHDPRVSPIEEVPVSVEATDDFGVKSLDLHYAVNGGAEQVVRLRAKGAKEEQGQTTLYLENFKLAPGDVVSMYATATDANRTTRSDILFAQAEAYDYKFSQSQQAGGMGGGGGGGQDGNISERQKQIIAATFNQLKGDPSAEAVKAAAREQARFLADTEAKLGMQAQTMAERMKNRELSQANAEFENFGKLMTAASAAMGDAVRQLAPGKWQDALGPEQKALQSLLRAEAIFQDIQVAFGQQGGGAGGGAQRELARMFDLELDKTKNQYESGQSPAEAAAQQQKEIDAAFERLQMLAKRQQELAQQNNGQQAAEQRWQEEQLRREAEELKRQLRELAQNSQNGQNSEESQSGQQSGQQSGGRGEAGSKQAANSGGERAGKERREMGRAMQQASNAVSEAENEMRKAVGSGDAAAQQRAAGQLAQAQRQLSSALHRNAGNSLSDLTDQANAIAREQKGLASRMKQLYGPQASGRDGAGDFSSTMGGEGAEMPEMNDPDNPRFSNWYRRRNWLQDAKPTHRTTPEEKALASDKDRLAQQLEQLQRGVEHQEQSLQSAAPDVARKLRRALSDAEQKELALRMEKNAQWIREGFGDRNLAMEDSVTAGVEQLSRDLQGAQQTLGAGDDKGQGGQNGRTAEALAQVRQLREQLERSQAAAQGQGKSDGRGSQQAASSAGQQSGAQGEPGQGGEQPGLAAGRGGSSEQALSRRDLQQAIGELSTLRGQISGQDRALGSYLGGALGYLRDLNADPRVLDKTIGQDAVASLERLEAELSRRLGEQGAEGARSGIGETSPEKYRDAVAEYYKKLSEPAKKVK